MAQIKISGLHKRFPGDVAAVDGVDLVVRENELLCLLGPSGCGKTTMLRCIAGLEEPTSGEIWVDEDCLCRPGRSTPPEGRDIGMIFQSYAVWPHMTVFENVAFSLRLKKLDGDTIRRRVTEALELVGLEHLADRDSTDLSGGQQQRVAVARSIVMEPRVLLFDEPLSNLDANLREYMRFELRRLQRRLGTTAVYVTHDQAEAMAIADRIAIMTDGRIVQIGSPQDLYHNPATEFVARFIGMTNLIEAEVSAVADDRIVVQTEQGVSMHAPASHKFGLGDPVLVCIRPEVVQVLPEAVPDAEPAPNTWPGVVREIVFLGSRTEIFVEVQGLEVRVQVPSRLEGGVDLNEKHRFHIPPEQLIVLPRTGEEPPPPEPDAA